MNGFENQLKSRILGAAPHIIIKGNTQPLNDLKAIDGVDGASPISRSQAMIQGDNELSAVMMQGIEPTIDLSINPVAKHMRYGDFSSLEAGKYRVLLGRTLARQLNVSVGDKVRIISAQRSVYTPFGRMPSQRNFTISGVFEMASQIDSSLAIVHISDAKRLLREPADDNNTIRLFLDNAFDDAKVAAKLSLAHAQSITTWRSEYGELFAAVKMEKNMMWLMLSLIIAVAAFNIISALVILVTEKQTDIAIFSTLGLARYQIALIFVVQGTVNGIIGTLIGCGAGLTLTYFLNDILRILKLNIVANPVDPLAGLPILVDTQQIVYLVIATVVVTLLSTLYPSFKAGRIDPAKALKHD